MKLDEEDWYNILLLVNMVISGVLLLWRLNKTFKKLEEGLEHEALRCR